MKAEPVRLILATGGPGMVKAAYSSGKPAIGVGAGNGPAYIHRSADVAHALACIARSKSFDYGTVCASEQSIIVEKGMESAVRSEGERQGFYFMDTTQAGALAKLLFRPNGTLNPDIVGRARGKAGGSGRIFRAQRHKGAGCPGAGGGADPALLHGKAMPRAGASSSWTARTPS